jgi:hypothetical protein
VALSTTSHSIHCRWRNGRRGGAPVLEQDITIFGQPLREIGYGWPDIHEFIARAAAGERQGR